MLKNDNHINTKHKFQLDNGKGIFECQQKTTSLLGMPCQFIVNSYIDIYIIGIPDKHVNVL